MLLAALMADITPDPSVTGEVLNDNNVLAVNIGLPGAEVGTYAVVQVGVEGVDAQLNPVTQDKQYIRQGLSTTKTGTQRTFSVSGDRHNGDEFQDFALDHKIMYGTGAAVITDYVFFSLLSGKGEKGRVSIIVNSDGSGNAGEAASIDIELRKAGALPEPYEYTATP